MADILVLTGHDTAFAGVAEVTTPSHARYASQRGYSYYIERTGFCKNRPASWSKLLFIRRHLPHFDFLLWLDTDVLVTGTTDLLKLAPTGSAVVTASVDLNGVNGGVLLWRRCSETFATIDRLWAQEDVVDHVWWETAALMRLQEESPELIKVVPKRLINSYQDDWQPGDFVLHAAGVPDPADKVKLLHTYAGREVK